MNMCAWLRSLAPAAACRAVASRGIGMRFVECACVYVCLYIFIYIVI
jgi:hypothetical protein